jgi:hypothetical protein
MQQKKIVESVSPEEKQGFLMALIIVAFQDFIPWNNSGYKPHIWTNQRPHLILDVGLAFQFRGSVGIICVVCLKLIDWFVCLHG